MFTFIYKKIVRITDQACKFVSQNLVQIVIIVGLFVVFEVIQSFPYINIIPNYQFLVIGFTLFLTVVLLRVSMSNKKIILAVLALFSVAAVASIFDIKRISDFIGFVIFVLLMIVIIRQIANDRGDLKKSTLE